MDKKKTSLFIRITNLLSVCLLLALKCGVTNSVTNLFSENRDTAGVLLLFVTPDRPVTIMPHRYGTDMGRGNKFQLLTTAYVVDLPAVHRFYVVFRVA